MAMYLYTQGVYLEGKKNKEKLLGQNFEEHRKLKIDRG